MGLWRDGGNFFDWVHYLDVGDADCRNSNGAFRATNCDSRWCYHGGGRFGFGNLGERLVAILSDPRVPGDRRQHIHQLHWSFDVFGELVSS